KDIGTVRKIPIRCGGRGLCTPGALREAGLLGGALPAFRAGLLKDLLSRWWIRRVPAQAQWRAHLEGTQRALSRKIEFASSQLADVLSGAALIIDKLLGGPCVGLGTHLPV